MTDETSPVQPVPEGYDPAARPPGVGATGAREPAPVPESRPIDVEPTSDPAGVFAVPDLAATGVAAPLGDVTDEGDTAFAATLNEETLHFGEPAPAPIVCQWCNAPLADPSAAICPSCGGRLQPVDTDIVVPGVTTLPAEALEAELRLRRHIQDAATSASARVLGDTPATPPVPAADILKPVPDGDPVFRPPSDEVARLMRQMELEARIAQVEREVPEEVLEQAEAAAAANGGGAAAVQPDTMMSAIDGEPAAETAAEPPRTEPRASSSS